MQFVAQFIIAYLILTWLGQPLARRLLPRCPDQGIFVAPWLGFSVLTWFLWILVSLEFLKISAFSVFLVFTSIAIARVVTNRFSLPGFSPPTRFSLSQIASATKPFALFLILFFVSFLSSYWLRQYQPDIFGLEKFPDYGLMNSILKGGVLPPLDIFASGETANYYYYGHFQAAVLSLFSSVPLPHNYNLHMSLLFASCVLLCFSAGRSLYILSADPLPLLHTSHKKQSSKKNVTASTSQKDLAKQSVMAGLLVIFFVLLFGNFETFYTSFTRGLAGYAYPQATRYIENTIHEFPLYSFMVNDMHGHLLNLPNTLVILILIFHYRTDLFKLISTASPLRVEFFAQLNLVDKLQLFTLFAFFGACYVTNAWDFVTLQLLFGFVLWHSLSHSLRTTQPSLSKLRTAINPLPTLLFISVICVVVGILCFFPYWLHFTPPSKGLGWVPPGKSSPLHQLIIIWIIHSILPILFLFKTYRNKTDGAAAPDPYKIFLPLILLSFSLIFAMEFIFIRDIYPTHFRANTLFKIGFQIWVWLGLVSALLWIKFWNFRSRGKLLSQASLIYLLFCGMYYLPVAVPQVFGQFQQKRSLEGTDFLKQMAPEDLQLIEWINTHLKNQDTLLEAVTESFSFCGRISVFTGMPNVIQWPVHEWLWRGSWDDSFKPLSSLEKRTKEKDSVALRKAEVQVIYEGISLPESRLLLKKHGVRWIVIGDTERKTYPQIHEEKLRALGSEKIRFGNTVLLEVY